MMEVVFYMQHPVFLKLLEEKYVEYRERKEEHLIKSFDDYSSKSSLPKKVLEYMREIYITRNQEPNSCHGNISEERHYF